METKYTMVVAIVVGAVFCVTLIVVAIVFIEDAGSAFLAVICLVSGFIFTAGGFYKDGQGDKTPADLQGQCIANVQLTQYPGRTISSEAQKLRVLLYHNGKCSGQLTIKNG